MSRWRLIEEQNGNTHISSVILSDEEASETIQVEIALHKAAGWVMLDSEAEKITMVSPRGTMRTIWVQEFDPMHDSP